MTIELNWNKAFSEAFNGKNRLLNRHLENLHDSLVLPLSRKKAKNEFDAKEIASLSIAKFWERFYLKKEPLPSNIEGYVYTITVNTVFYFYKVKNKLRMKETDLDWDNLARILSGKTGLEKTYTQSEEQNEKETLYKAMETAMEKMCDVCKNLLRRSILEKKKLIDIHMELGIPSANAASKKKVKCMDKLIKLSYQELSLLKKE